MGSWCRSNQIQSNLMNPSKYIWNFRNNVLNQYELRAILGRFLFTMFSRYFYVEVHNCIKQYSMKYTVVTVFFQKINNKSTEIH